MEIYGFEFCEVGENIDFRLVYQQDYKNLSILTYDPTGKEIIPIIKKSDNPGTRMVRLTTSKIGFYKVNVVKSKTNNLLCSKTCFAYNLQKERWHLVTIQWTLDKIEFIMEMRMHHPIVDCIMASAHLLSSVNDTVIKHVVVKCNIDILPDKSCKFYFTPPQYGSYEIRFMCNNIPISSPRPQVHVINRKKWKLIHTFTTDKGLTSIGQKASFIFELYGAPSEFLKAWVKCPDKSTVNMLLYGEEKYNKIGQLRCDFIPTIVGLHSLVACYQDVVFEKCPLEFYVYDGKMVEIVSVDPDINSGIKPTVGQSITIAYSCLQSDREKISVTAVGSEDSGIYTTVHVEKSETDSKGIVTFSIKLQFAGQYLIEGYFKKQKINCFQVEVLPSLEIHESNFSEPITIVRQSERFQEPPDILVESFHNDSENRNSQFVEETSKCGLLSIDDECNISNDCKFPIVTGDGLVNAEVGKDAIFTVDPRQIKGKLTVDVTGPKSLAKCLIKPQSVHGRYEVEYFPEEVGLYQITVLWNDQPIDGSPFEVEATDLSTIILKGHGLKGAWVGESAKFFVDTFNVGEGKLSLNLCGTKKEMKNISVEVEEQPNGTYECTYQGSTSGEYLLHIAWGDQIVKGSPFPIVIWDKNPSRQVKCQGDGLKYGLVGEISVITIEISYKSLTESEDNYGMVVTCIGPDNDRIPCNIIKQNNTQYQVNFTAQTSGRHQLNILYGNVHVLGSPFYPVFTNKSNLEKIEVFGPGLYSNCLQNFESYFTVDTRNAGVGKLRVQVKGPKEAFRVEVQKDPTDNRLIKCSYNPTETGEYTISINWSGFPIKGSPFQILLD